MIYESWPMVIESYNIFFIIHAYDLLFYYYMYNIYVKN